MKRTDVLVCLVLGVGALINIGVAQQQVCGTDAFCENGECNTANSQCACEPSYGGLYCNRTCTDGCTDDQYCQEFNQTVVGCMECTEACSANYICITEANGPKCAVDCPSNTAMCGNNGMCNTGTGKCMCDAGWGGYLCDKQCADGCLDTQYCMEMSELNIHCMPCNPGCAEGLVCATENNRGICVNCLADSTMCTNGATCNMATGLCDCVEGWQGFRCDQAISGTDGSQKFTDKFILIASAVALAWTSYGHNKL